VVTATFTDIKAFNPFLATDSETQTYNRLMQAGLIRLHPVTQEPEASLAESWKISKDQLLWTFSLRKGLKWSDGRPFDANDVLFTMQLVNDPKIPSLASDALTLNGKKIEWSLVDQHTVQAKLPSAFATFLRHLDAGSCPIIARHRWQKEYEQGRFTEIMRASMDPNQFQGLGPFRLKQYAPGEKLVLSRNPHYWKIDSNRVPLPYIEQLVFLILGNQDQIQLKVENGEIDTYQGVRPGDVDRLKEKANALQLRVINVGPIFDMEGLFLNQNAAVNPETKKPYVDPIKLSWFQNVNFRRALSHAIDRNALIRNSLFGHGIAAYGPESPGNKRWYNPDISKFQFDLAKSRQLLLNSGFYQRQEAGKPALFDSKGNRVHFSLFTNSGNSIRNTQSIMIASDFAKLGIQVAYSALDFQTLINRVDRTHQYDAVLLGISDNDVDPGGRLNIILSKGSLHFWWPRQVKPFTPWEKRIDDLMALTMSTSNFQERKKYYNYVQRILSEQQAMIYTVHPYAFVCAKTKLGNLKPIAQRHRTLWNAEELYWQ
jgi:peptide/nickel transport system substrate-binding protein